ncbi:MAG TPA: winged helix-turn-helix domain-containing protein [Candidatus Glassbacteria bacterium]|nr:winged helix-turn-helix domain-containing protein [Candidatus Glassbacteria bacterium]
MGNPAGVRRDFAALEKRRQEALGWWEKGWRPAEIARRVNVVRQTVGRWARQYRQEGRASWKRAERAGRKPLLREQDRQRLAQRLLQGPEALGYETPLGTCPRVGHRIEQEFGIRYHEGQVWKLLAGLGWSPQRPTGRARERDKERIRIGKKKTWPAIKKKPAGKAARSSSSTKADGASGRIVAGLGPRRGRRR